MLRAIKFYNPGETGLESIERIIEQSGESLCPGARLIFEIGFDQSEAVTALLDKHGLFDYYFKHDLTGYPRAAVARRKAT